MNLFYRQCQWAPITRLDKVLSLMKHGDNIPALITPGQRRTFDAQGQITNSHGDYTEAVRQAAKEENVPFIDLNAMIKPLFEAWGPEGSKRAFAPNDGTHHNYGSYELARRIVNGIKDQQT